ncbi:hypothetical protein MMP66_07735 [Acinetobacter dispersus]|uniref:hypothetical protein n=1 Tax=Acinetobacter dispersus TaxID=70348 RepID=UPI001F4B610B|nr:hypothetical protein [Acinetobacter dispersus]MCH7394170.1 hypothetical protein [Acinetobacter dispersus]
MGLIIAAKFWREILIIFLAFLLVITFALYRQKTSQLKVAEQKCFEKIQVIENAQVKALTQAQNKANKASADYEKLRSEQRTKVETVTREVQKIVERPLYQRDCFDSDGLSEINSIIKTSDSS